MHAGLLGWPDERVVHVGLIDSLVGSALTSVPGEKEGCLIYRSSGEEEVECKKKKKKESSARMYKVVLYRKGAESHAGPFWIPTSSQ